MKKYREVGTGRNIVEVNDLSFLKYKDHEYGWLKRHALHFRLKLALYNADMIYAADSTIGVDLVRYYFVPKEKIIINTNITKSVPDEA